MINLSSRFKRRFRRVSLVLLVAAIPATYAFRTADNYFELSKNLEILTSIVKETNTFYVDEIEPAKLLKVGIDAMLKSLDPYTEFYSESELQDYQFLTTGQYGGIGATIAKREEYVMIAEPYEGWPAQLADLRGGDLIIEIDGRTMKGKNTDEVSKNLKGEPNTEVKILIRRQGEAQLITKSLTRKEIKIKNVPYYGMINQNVGYIKFAGFRQNAAEEVREGVVALKGNPGLKGIVLDLRGNPGGLLDEAIQAVNLFVPRNQIVVSTKGKMPDWNKEYRTSEEPTELNLPVVVLIDTGSASASEIVSGSLQDFDRGVLVGANSYGKGLVQTTRPLPYNTQMKITTSKYYIPSGRCIQAVDYAHRAADGSAGLGADSTIKAFKTKNGRVVFDGRGVKPDLVLARETYPDVVISLGQKSLFFDYATKFRASHANIEAPDQFQVTEAIFQDFLTFLKDKSYTYTTDTEEQLEKLIKTSKDEKYYDALQVDITALRGRLTADKTQDVLKYRTQIEEILEEEIASRYYYQSGRIRAGFDDDKDVQEAIRLINNPTAYSEVLTAGRR